MSDKRFDFLPLHRVMNDTVKRKSYYLEDKEDMQGIVDLLNEQQELIEELHLSDEMGWKRAEHFEKKCPKELHNKKMYIKRLEYKVQHYKEENEQLKQQLYESEKHYLIETSDISDKPYLEEELSELKKKYGVIDDE